MCVSLAVVAGIALVGGEPGPARGAAAPTEGQVQAIGSTGGTACKVGSDCVDDNACTTDLCDSGACVFTQIPGCVPCDPSPTCETIDVVFLMDTSGSMKDEGAALCAAAGDAVGQLAAMGITVNVTALGIAEAPGGVFSCLDGDVISLYSEDVPGCMETCGFVGGQSQLESWGPATAITAEQFPWTPGSVRLIVPMSDEGACNGNRPDGCNDPGDDRDSVENAINVARAFGVTVSPITGTGSSACVNTLAADLATGTGGSVFNTSDAGTELLDAILGIVQGACPLDTSCDDGDFCTHTDTCVAGVCTGLPAAGCKDCTATGFCSDGNACTVDVCVNFECVTTPGFDVAAQCCNPMDGALSVINDGNACTQDICDATTGLVVHEPVANDTPCDDGLFCTVCALCTNGTCSGGVERDCSHADNQCGVGVCNEATDACEALPANDGDLCDDGLFCTIGETCGNGGCGDGDPRDCGGFDDNCNVGLCDETADQCEPAAINEADPCEDGLFCTINETCTNGLCGGGVPRDCSPLDDACNQGVCNETLDLCEPLPVNEGKMCDDLLFCTVDEVCVLGNCQGPPRDCSSLDEQCREEFCSEPNQACETRPDNVGLLCSDGDACTFLDLCRGDGVCRGTDIDSLSCARDEDCAGSRCSPLTRTCVCDGPDLCLEIAAGGLPEPGCFQAGELVTVDVVLKPSPAEVARGQFSVGFDPASLEFVDAIPGTLGDPASPFTDTTSLFVDEVSGVVCFSVTIAPGLPGVTVEALMARLRFRARDTCSTSELALVNTSTCITRLTDIVGREVPFIPCGGGEIIADGPAPVLTCPESVAINADPGGVTGLVTWDPVTADPGCGGATTVFCSSSSSSGVSVDHLIDGGGVHPSGLSTFECAISDPCGAQASCSWSVQVRPTTTVGVSLQLSPTIVPGPLNRCIEFEFFSSCIELPARIEQLVEFGGSFNLPGRAGPLLLFKVPAGQYACVTARDPLHTLRSVSDLTIVDRTYIARFESEPFFGGNWLVGGNLDGDREIDIVDFGVFLTQFLTTVNADTPCGLAGPHADINGDGIVDALDFSFISSNFLGIDKEACCPGGSAAAAAQPTQAISIRDLRSLGLGDLSIADLNQDGVLDALDFSAFLEGRRPTRKANRLRALPSRKRR